MALDKHFTAYCCEWTYEYFGTENVQDERKCLEKVLKNQHSCLEHFMIL